MALGLKCKASVVVIENPACILLRGGSAISGIRTAAALMKHPKSGVNSPNPADGCGCLCLAPWGTLGLRASQLFGRWTDTGWAILQRGFPYVAQVVSKIIEPRLGGCILELNYKASMLSLK